MGLKIIGDAAYNDGWLIEATETSTWFGFVDDFIVRLAPGDGAVSIDVRSKSRVGGSDLGVNARRVRAFMEKMTERRLARHAILRITELYFCTFKQ